LYKPPSFCERDGQKKDQAGLSPLKIVPAADIVGFGGTLSRASAHSAGADHNLIHVAVIGPVFKEPPVACEHLAKLPFFSSHRQASVADHASQTHATS
jgi:hypothetical protein